MNVNIELIDNMGRTTNKMLLRKLEFIPDVLEVMHLDPESFKPKVKRYAKDDCIAVKVWSRSINIPRHLITIKVLGI